MVVAAGNEANARRHYLGNLAPLQEYEDVEISVGDNIGGFTAELFNKFTGSCIGSRAVTDRRKSTTDPGQGREVVRNTVFC